MTKLYLPVLCLGELAVNVLLPDSEGVVIATLSKAAYLKDPFDDVIWLIPAELPMSKRAIQIAGSLPELAVNTHYVLKDKVLRLKSGCCLDLHFAKEWKPPVIPPDKALPIECLIKNLDPFVSSWTSLSPPSGFGKFIPEIMTLAQAPAKIVNAYQKPELKVNQRFAWSSIHQIVRACLRHDLHAMLMHAVDLIGLGEGLTPSGDDFIGGLLFCIRTLQDIYRPFHPSILPLVEDFIEHSKSRTNLISYTMLKDHAHGHASEILHAFIHALFTDQDQQTIVHLGSELIQIGHSTGWDLLAGILTGLLLTYL
jgi:hypothetical protein